MNAIEPPAMADSFCQFPFGRIFFRIGYKKNMEKFLYISIGAIFGANSRFWLSEWAANRWGASFPFGTLIINLSGSFLMGVLISYLSNQIIVDPRVRLIFAIGFLGAYTTFSTYTFESYNLIFNGQWISGLFNLFGSSLLGLLAIGLGIFVGKLL